MQQTWRRATEQQWSDEVPSISHPGRTVLTPGGSWPGAPCWCGRSGWRSEPQRQTRIPSLPASLNCSWPSRACPPGVGPTSARFWHVVAHLRASSPQRHSLGNWKEIRSEHFLLLWLLIRFHLQFLLRFYKFGLSPLISVCGWDEIRLISHQLLKGQTQAR